MAISTRRIGATVACPICRGDVVVPAEDALDLPSAVAPEAPPASPAPEPPQKRVPQPSLVPAVAAQPASELPPASVSPLSPEPSELVTPYPSANRTNEEWLDEEDSEDEEDDALNITRSRPADEELDLTAMVDVVFQLLIFFMVTASFSLQKTIEVPKPDQPRQGVAPSLQPLEELQDLAILVAIDARNSVTIDDEPLNDLSQLADVLRERMRRDRKSELILTSDRQATHRTMIAVVDAANEVGMQRIRLATSGRRTE